MKFSLICETCTQLTVAGLWLWLQNSYRRFLLYRPEGNRQKQQQKKQKTSDRSSNRGVGLSSDLQPGQGQPVLTSLSRRDSDSWHICAVYKKSLTDPVREKKSQKHKKIQPWWLFWQQIQACRWRKTANTCHSVPHVIHRAGYHLKQWRYQYQSFNSSFLKWYQYQLSTSFNTYYTFCALAFMWCNSHVV